MFHKPFHTIESVDGDADKTHGDVEASLDDLDNSGYIKFNFYKQCFYSIFPYIRNYA